MVEGRSNTYCHLGRNMEDNNSKTLICSIQKPCLKWYDYLIWQLILAPLSSVYLSKYSPLQVKWLIQSPYFLLFFLNLLLESLRKKMKKVTSTWKIILQELNSFYYQYPNLFLQSLFKWLQLQKIKICPKLNLNRNQKLFTSMCSIVKDKT